jgi:hypothetical protein
LLLIGSMLFFKLECVLVLPRAYINFEYTIEFI